MALAGLPAEEAERYDDRILRRYFPPLPLPTQPDGSPEHRETEILVSLMARDKKNTAAGEATFVLLKSPGNPVTMSIPLTDRIISRWSD